MATHALMTVEQFVQMNAPENGRCERVDGELVPVPGATTLHNNIRGLLEHLVRGYFERTPIRGTLSETDCRIGEDTVRMPDLGIFLGDRWLQLNMKKITFPYAPDIAVEVLSPSEHARDLNRKFRDYLSAGSQEIWLLDPENGELPIRTQPDTRILQIGDTLESPLLPGFSASVEVLPAGR